MTRIIHIAGHSGSGKSVISLNLAAALHHLGKEVILLDSNLYSPAIAHYADLRSSVYLNDFIEGRAKIDDVICQHASGIHIIPSIIENSHVPAKHMMINEALLKLIGKADIVIVDSFSHAPALYSVLDHADETVFICEDNVHHLLTVRDMIAHMEDKGLSVTGVVLNKKHPLTSAKHVEHILGKRVLATLPHDKHMTESIRASSTCYLDHPNAPSSKAIDELAKTLY